MISANAQDTSIRENDPSWILNVLLENVEMIIIIA